MNIIKVSKLIDIALDTLLEQTKNESPVLAYLLFCKDAYMRVHKTTELNGISLVLENLEAAAQTVLDNAYREKYLPPEIIIKDKAQQAIALFCMYLANKDKNTLSLAIQTHTEMLLGDSDVEGVNVPLTNPLRGTGRTQRLVERGIFDAMREVKDVMFIGHDSNFTYNYIRDMALEFLVNKRIPCQIISKYEIKLLVQDTYISFMSFGEFQQNHIKIGRGTRPINFVYDHHMPHKPIKQLLNDINRYFDRQVPPKNI